ncbi:MAG: hypothetical protein Q9174_001687 [Haloplaca sp. 1 TL-2023]
MNVVARSRRAYLPKLAREVCVPPRNIRKAHSVSDVPRLAASKLEDSSDRVHTTAVATALREKGVTIVDLKFPDASSQYLRGLVLGLNQYHGHGLPITHSAERGWFWDVTPKVKTAGFQARSESCLDFPWHTDCSYESDPPQFFALHVLRADRNGGGTLSALNVSLLMGKLKSSTLDSLSQRDFQIKVPPEFAKGIPSITGRLLGRADEQSNVYMRYRADIVQPLSSRASDALRELNQSLKSERTMDAGSGQLRLSPEVLPDNSIVLMDNGRWLHARNEVRDPKRHLRRVRWGRRQFGDV